jgi:hypothetical protein
MKTEHQNRKDFEMKPAVRMNASTDVTPGISFQFNTRLIAAVQTKAGARCHESANLVQAYYFRADVYRMQLRNNNVVAAETARRNVQQAEVRLREFLTEVSWPCSWGGEVSCDCQAVAC